MRLALLLLLAAGCGHRYRVNEAAENVPNVFLHEVRVRGGATTLVFRLEAEEACEIGVPPPGDPAAFVLRAGERTLALTDVSGVEELPATTGVGARGSRRLTLEFEPLPEGVREFDVAGEIAGTGTVAFAVRLDAPNVVKCP
ncbi:MAG: hypothetical protein ACHQ1G_10480 [Planctomycetota bacterium]